MVYYFLIVGVAEQKILGIESICGRESEPMLSIKCRGDPLLWDGEREETNVWKPRDTNSEKY